MEGLREVKAKLGVYLHPSRSSNVKQGVYEILNALLLRCELTTVSSPLIRHACLSGSDVLKGFPGGQAVLRLCRIIWLFCKFWV